MHLIHFITPSQSHYPNFLWNRKTLYCNKETHLLEQNDLPFCSSEEEHGRRPATCIASLFGAAV
jgi:hypothetical protein